MFSTLFLAASKVRPQSAKTEIWLPVAGWDNYEVSNLGNVRNIAKQKGGQKLDAKLLKPNLNKHTGRRSVFLHQNGQKVRRYVYRLAALAFIPNPKNKPCVNHKDGKKQNDCVTNLEWVTHKENMKHAIQNGLIAKRGQGLGQDEILAIQELRKAGAKVCHLAEIFRVSRVCIWNHTAKAV